MTMSVMGRQRYPAEGVWVHVHRAEVLEVRERRLLESERARGIRRYTAQR